MTRLTDVLKRRRSIYALNRQLPVSEDEVLDLIKEATELVPDAFNMKSQRVIVVLGDKQDTLWDGIYDAFGGKVARAKIDSFKAAYGTILYFIDDNTVCRKNSRGMQKISLYGHSRPMACCRSISGQDLLNWESVLIFSITTRLSTIW